MAWPVEAWHANCGVRTPTVFIGPEGMNALGCPVSYDVAALVIMGLDTAPTSGHWHATPLNGLRAIKMSTSFVSGEHNIPHTKSGYVTCIYVRLPTKGMTISIRVGDSAVFPGRAPGRATRFLESIHAVGRIGNATSVRTGTVTGIAGPCIVVSPKVSHAYAVHSVLRRGTKVVGTRTVTDSLQVGDRWTVERFTFREPAGNYIAVNAEGAKQRVTIKPGKTIRVSLPNTCGRPLGLLATAC